MCGSVRAFAIPNVRVAEPVRKAALVREHAMLARSWLAVVQLRDPVVRRAGGR